MLRPMFFVFAAALLMPLLVGCEDPLHVVPASGVVTWNGMVVPNAEITFLRNDSAGPAAIATTDAQGHFQLKTGEHPGIVPGEYKVVVQKSNVAEMKLPEPLPKGMSLSAYLRTNNILAYPVLPLRYMTATETPLKVHVRDEAENQFELKLEGRSPTVPKEGLERATAA